jgi:hypothetical protein
MMSVRTQRPFRSNCLPDKCRLPKAATVQDPVTITSSAADPQLGKEVGDTVTVILFGWLENDSSVTGATPGLHVKESEHCRRCSSLTRT